MNKVSGTVHIMVYWTTSVLNTMIPQYHVKVMNTVIKIIYCAIKIDKQTNGTDCKDGDIQLVGCSTEY